MDNSNEHDSFEPMTPIDGVELPEEEGQATHETPKKKKRSSKRAFIVLGVVVAVIVVAGIGFWVWHETPNFCGTMCHDTMGSYLEGYENSDLLVAEHAANNVRCLDCHEAEISTQIAELQTQISGDYRIPLAKMEVEDEFCLRDGCHSRAEIEDALADYVAPDGTQINPHVQLIDPNSKGRVESPHNSGSEIACAECHTSHRDSKEISYCYKTCHHTETFEKCTDCHDD